MKTLECLKIPDNATIHFMRLPQMKWLSEIELEKRECDKIIKELQDEILWLRAELESRNH